MAELKKKIISMITRTSERIQLTVSHLIVLQTVDGAC